MTQSILYPNASWIGIEVFWKVEQNWCFRQWSFNNDELSSVVSRSWTPAARSERGLCNLQPSAAAQWVPPRRLDGPLQVLRESCRGHCFLGSPCLVSLQPCMVLPLALYAELWEAWASDVLTLAPTAVHSAFPFWFPSTQVFETSVLCLVESQLYWNLSG